MTGPLILAFVAILWARAALGHEIRPSYLEITQPSSDHYHLLWKQPAVGPMAARLTPRLSNGWLDHPPMSQSIGNGYRLAAFWLWEQLTPIFA